MHHGQNLECWSHLLHTNLHTQPAVKILHYPNQNNTLRLSVMTHYPYFPPTQLGTSNLSNQIDINHPPQTL